MELISLLRAGGNTEADALHSGRDAVRAVSDSKLSDNLISAMTKLENSATKLTWVGIFEVASMQLLSFVIKAASVLHRSFHNFPMTFICSVASSFLVLASVYAFVASSNPSNS